MADPDPTRLVDDGSPLVRSLLASADGDSPDADRRAAIGKRLGITAAVLASSTKASAVTGGAALWWKLGALAVLLAGATGIAIVTRDGDAPAVAVPVAVVEQAAPVVVAPPPVVEPAPAPVVEPAVVEPAPAPVAEPAVVAPAVVVAPHAPAVVAPPPRRPRPAKVVVEPPPPVVAAAPPAAPVAIDARRLALEVGLLDSARAALRSGDPTAALAILARHDREFADGALVAEAEVIRIEALVKRGDMVEARTRATEFAARFPKSPLLRRVRSIVKEEP